jgi:hypothetical protein
LDIGLARFRRCREDVTIARQWADDSRMISSIPSPTGAGGAMRLAGDKRRSARVPHVMDAWICSPTAVDPVDERVEVRSVNISRHGVGFVVDHELATGAFWIIEIGIGDQRLMSEIRVMNCRKLEGGEFEVGAEFC